jgi:hypothetical protein
MFQKYLMMKVDGNSTRNRLHATISEQYAWTEDIIYPVSEKWMLSQRLLLLHKVGVEDEEKLSNF